MPDLFISISGGPGWHIDSAGAGLIAGSLTATLSSSYINIIGSPNYNLPITGSVYATIGSSVVVNVDVNVSDYISIVGSPNYSLPIIGSMQVSSITGALPAGTNNIGDVDILTLPAQLGSVEVSSIRNALPVGTNMLGSVVSKGDPFDTSAQGTVWITTSSVRIMEPRVGRQSFRVIPTGSTSSLNVNGKIWFTPGPTAATFQGAECILGQPWGIKYWEGSVAGITDAGSIAISYYEVF